MAVRLSGFKNVVWTKILESRRLGFIFLYLAIETWLLLEVNSRHQRHGLY